MIVSVAISVANRRFQFISVAISIATWSISDRTFEEKQKLKIIETSSKSNINVDEVFIELIDKLQQLGLGVVQHSLSSGYGEEDEQNKTIKLDEAENNEPKKGCCKKNNGESEINFGPPPEVKIIQTSQNYILSNLII